MDSQAKQKATHDVHSKFREFYPGDRVLVKDLRKEDTWWPGLVAERSGPRSYVVVLNDGRVWKRHVDHLRRDSMDRAATDPSREMEFQDKPPDIPLAIPLSVSVPNPSQTRLHLLSHNLQKRPPPPTSILWSVKGSGQINRLIETI